MLLALAIGYSLWNPWIVVSLALYVLVGLCWLPVVWIQVQMRDLARRRRGAGPPAGALSPAVPRLVRLGWPAFIGVIAIFALMIWKPRLW